MILRISQLKSLIPLITLLFFGCAKHRVDREKAISEILSDIPARWLAYNKTNSLENINGEAEPHLFFDLDSGISNNLLKVKVVVTTPLNSPYAFEVDLKSGQRYYHHSFCSQKDVWGKRSEVYNLPSYSSGYIPRVLDQLGGPQKVLVFGNSIKNNFHLDRRYYEVNIIGGFVEKICPARNCVAKRNWLSRIVLIGLDSVDPLNKNIKDLETFKNVYHWDSVVGQLENVDGRNFISETSLPMNQVGDLYDRDKIWPIFKKFSKFFAPDEMLKIMKACHGIYEKLWKDIGEPMSNRENLEFSSKMAAFLKLHKREILTCDRFVYHGNINENSNRFWFLNSIMLFFRLNEDGHYFNCDSKSWMKNIRDNRGNLSFNLQHDLRKCKDKDLNTAMIYLPNYINNLRNSNEPYLRFVDYDNHAFGTHRKLYSWVAMKTKKFDCSDDPNLKVLKTLKITPEEVVWNMFDITKDSKGQLKENNKPSDQIIK